MAKVYALMRVAREMPTYLTAAELTAHFDFIANELDVIRKGGPTRHGEFISDQAQLSYHCRVETIEGKPE